MSSINRLEESDPELKPWDERLSELAGDLDDVDTMLMELEPRSGADTAPAAEARGQLELFGTLLSSLVEQRQDGGDASDAPALEHQIIAADGTAFEGSWEDIVRRMRDSQGNPAHSVQEYMSGVSQHGFRQTGVRIPTHDAESFLRASARAGLLRIVR